MTAINFPDSPSVNDVFTVGDISWKWTGVAWETFGAEYGGLPTGGTTGQILAKIDGDDYNTEWVDDTAGAVALSDLTDVTTPTPSNGEILFYDGSVDAWVNMSFLELLISYGALSGDGGSYNTTEFAGTIDGGLYNTTEFIND
jgi:hypothetical protein